jgi:hypothetical protein
VATANIFSAKGWKIGCSFALARMKNRGLDRSSEQRRPHPEQREVKLAADVLQLKERAQPAQERRGVFTFFRRLFARKRNIFHHAFRFKLASGE